MRRLSLTLLGTGSSGGVPRINGDWGACDPADPRNRRSRCSAILTCETPQGRSRLLIDTSPDLRTQCLAAGIDHIDAIAFSHDHADQSHGLDDVRVLAYQSRRRLPVHVDASTARSLVTKFDYAFAGRGGYPSILELQRPLVPGAPFGVPGEAPFEVVPLRQVHGPIASLGFRCGPIAYCNDVSGLPEATLCALKGVEVLVLDALRDTPHPTHADVATALEWIEMLKPERAVLTNLHIDLDYEELEARLPAGVEPATDGLVLTTDFP